jgi:3-hydroxyacyl-[acyl-carrier-protein] dehydratase
MPPPAILDPASLDCSRVLHTRDDIYRILPQRFEFAQLDAIIHVDPQAGTAAGYRDVRPDEWWCRGHMPGQPIFPGILMLECAAQLAAFVQHMHFPVDQGFMAFGGVDGAKFRGSVIPPSRVILTGRLVEARSRRFVCDIQSYSGGEMVFEGRITGLPFKA